MPLGRSSFFPSSFFFCSSCSSSSSSSDLLVCFLSGRLSSWIFSTCARRTWYVFLKLWKESRKPSSGTCPSMNLFRSSYGGQTTAIREQEVRQDSQAYSVLWLILFQTKSLSFFFCFAYFEHIYSSVKIKTEEFTANSNTDWEHIWHSCTCFLFVTPQALRNWTLYRQVSWLITACV